LYFLLILIIISDIIVPIHTLIFNIAWPTPQMKMILPQTYDYHSDHRMFLYYMV